MIPTVQIIVQGTIVESISYSTLRSRLARTLDKVNDDRAPVLITRQRGKPAVLMSLDDYNSYAETDYLLRSPANAKRLYEAKAEIEAEITRRKKRGAKARRP